MDKKEENRLAKFFAKAFHEVVLPHFEEISKTLKGVLARLDRIEDKLTKIDDILDRHDTKLDNHEKRITKLETRPTIS